ncbi:hypothetical protein W824_05095 [Clavibacter cf. michiganensis LMG 26808]|nr:hypothetical protein W824_05095 [Clavibacter cf. michiganensis LMG 26808]
MSSLAGTSTRATSSSRWRRGEVAPVISVRAALTTSAARDSSTAPKATACARMRSSSSSGVPRSTAAAPSADVAPTMMRSRSRSSRSSTKRRGSWPVWMTRSTPANAAAASCRATASMTSSSSAACVYPRRATARSYSTLSSSDPAMSWSSRERVSRTDPPPARTTSGRTPGATCTLSSRDRCST